MRGAARRRGARRRSRIAVERAIARRPDVERDDHRRRRDAVEHDAAHAVRMAAQVFERDARAVGAAPEVDLRVAERGAHRVEVGDPRGGRVLRGVDAARGELLRARGGLRHRIELERRVDAVVGLERGAGERRRAAGAALVDEHDVAVLAHAGQLRGERRRDSVAACPGPPARMNSGSGRGLSVFAGSTATASVILRPSRLRAILRDLERRRIARRRRSFGSRHSASAIVRRAASLAVAAAGSHEATPARAAAKARAEGEPIIAARW